MTNDKYLNDLSEIKDLMSRSSRFLSLSGLSGVLAGIYALIGSGMAYYLLYGKTVYLRTNSYENYLLITQLLSIAFVVALLSVLTALLLSRKKAQNNNEKIWDATTKKMLFHFLVPLISGGVFGLILLKHEHYGIVAPITLIFYGIALVSAGKFTLNTIKYLGISQITIGLLSAYFVGYGLYFWAFGFGVLHIVYGTIMYIKEK